jgi:glycogen synthase
VSERPLRVAIVGRSVYGLHGYGGLERHLFDLARHHLAEGWQVTLITREPSALGGVNPARWSIVSDHPNCQVEYVPYRTFPLAGRRGTTIVDRSTAYPLFGNRAGRRAARLASAGELDLVYGVGASVLGYARAHGRADGPHAPLVFNPQGLEEFGGFDGSYGGRRLKGVGYAPLRRAVLAISASADAVIATDRSIEPIVAVQLPAARGRIRLIPNGIDVADLDPHVRPERRRATRSRHSIDVNDALLVSVGRLEASKGFADLIEALSSVDRSLPWRWVLVGDGPDRARLERMLKASGLASRVQFAGRADDETLHSWYDAADLFVHPTRYEGSSLVTLEAMLHRLPVLATRAGGLPDKVIPGRTGWLVPPRDPSALASALVEAIGARERWCEMGAAGRALLDAEFDWRVIQGRFRELYAELLKPRR